MTIDKSHKHVWVRSSRQHKRQGRIFVECECGAIRQASTVTGSLVVFETGAKRGGKTVVISIRLDTPRYKKLRALKLNARRIVEDYLDKLP